MQVKLAFLSVSKGCSYIVPAMEGVKHLALLLGAMFFFVSAMDARSIPEAESTLPTSASPIFFTAFDGKQAFLANSCTL